MITMRSSAVAVSTRQPQLPRNPPLPRSHRGPTSAGKPQKDQTKPANSRLKHDQIDPSSLPTQSSLQRKKDLVFNDTPDNQSFSESWPSTDRSSTTDTSANEAQSQACKNMIVTEPTEPSIMAKYIERFRYGKPQSREERQQRATEEADDQLFLWMCSSTNSSPTQESEKHFSDETDISDDCVSIQSPSITSQNDEDALLSAVLSLNFSELRLPEVSPRDPGDPDILQLQEQTDHLLLRSEHSVGSGSVLSFEGPSCSEISPPASPDFLRRPTMHKFLDSNNVDLVPTLCDRSVHPISSSLRSNVRREDDILSRWRLGRKMEQARQWGQESLSHNPALLITPSHTTGLHQKIHGTCLNSPKQQQSHLSFTPVTLASLDSPPVTQSPLPVSSPGITRLLPDVKSKKVYSTIQPTVQAPHSRESITVDQEASVAHPQCHKQIGTQVILLDCRRHQSTSHSTQTDIEQQTEQNSPLKEKHPGLTPKPKIRRQEIGPLSRKKNDQRVEQSSSRTRTRQAKDHQGLSDKPKKLSGKSRWRDEDHTRESTGEGWPEKRASSLSPIHDALGQVVSEVLFPGRDLSSSSDSLAPTPPSPPQSCAAPCTSAEQPFEVIDQLLQDAEDSDGLEFVDDSMLQDLRQKRHLVKEQIGKLDAMLKQSSKD